MLAGVSGAWHTAVAQSRVATCDPQAYAIVDSSTRRGYGVGAVYNSCSSGWDYTIKLINHAGSTLNGSTRIGTSSGSQIVNGPEVSCAGAYVRAFFYINVGGTGKSYTTGEDPSCAY
ncbi:MAG: hypothetical protein QOK32_861 [Gaiellaceae bacterium]|jgi:hypothetical protein|nr:hypothetical protein [Gaiellaceae bacterium]